MGGRGGGMLSPRGAGAGAWRAATDPGTHGSQPVRGEKAPKGQGCCEPWGRGLGNGTQ